MIFCHENCAAVFCHLDGGHGDAKVIDVSYFGPAGIFFLLL